MFRKLIISVFFAILIAQSSNADEIQVTNGSQLIGELIRIEADKVTFSTPLAGTITVSQDNVERIVTKKPVTLMMEDGRVFYDRKIVFTEQAMRVESKNEAPVIFAASDIEMINPEPF
mgnify:CR=1 FL=1